MLSALMLSPESSVTAPAARPYTGRRTFFGQNRYPSIHIATKRLNPTGGISLKSHVH